MLSSQKKEMLRVKTYDLLRKEGMKIANEEIAALLLKKGCSQAPSGRIRIPGELIGEMVASQKKSQKQDAEDQELYLTCGIDWAHHILWTNKQEEMRKKLGRTFMMSAFDCGPTKFYDYPTQKVMPVDTSIFVEMMKLAQSTPEIGYISTWYRQDVPQETERIESLILGLKYTDKVDGIEAIDPRQIKYLQDIGEIICDEPARTPFLAGSQCITSPLILEERSAEEMVERVKRGIKRFHITSMPTIGVSTPVTLAGSIVMSAAEILGGMAAAFCMDPDADLGGRMIANVLDMKTGSVTCYGPETAMLNLAVKELFDACFGGHLWVEVFFSPGTKRPGLQTVCENLYGVHSYAKLTENADICYPGMGTLDNGGMGSPTQFMLDMEIRKSQFALKNKIAVDEESLDFEEICEKVRDGDNFLSSDHTFRHFRELWSSKIFLTDEPKPGGWEGDEKSLLESCDRQWRENIKTVQPPEWPEEKMRALEEVLDRAKRELL
ncbi:MAG: trimethylamine methyltransferase family protein [Candidatus Latescibacteria bacterium]|nr:trimethylamine methyltransferase family protein [Candidatus Latescibacterota bacterium]